MRSEHDFGHFEHKLPKFTIRHLQGVFWELAHPLVPTAIMLFLTASGGWEITYPSSWSKGPTGPAGVAHGLVRPEEKSLISGMSRPPPRATRSDGRSELERVMLCSPLRGGYVQGAWILRRT